MQSMRVTVQKSLFSNSSVNIWGKWTFTSTCLSTQRDGRHLFLTTFDNRSRYFCLHSPAGGGTIKIPSHNLYFPILDYFSTNMCVNTSVAKDLSICNQKKKTVTMESIVHSKLNLIVLFPWQNKNMLILVQRHSFYFPLLTSSYSHNSSLSLNVQIFIYILNVLWSKQ